ncbi:ATP-binding protein [Mariprofundus ferrooxydans]|uniref:ATP-binding protein n=1 Tax=Mariprofundus ferrooxydans TaxID=314344 RepID=UPI00037D7A08|nr:ATP-binding protein [Mariprofundus ferrooxydans]
MRLILYRTLGGGAVALALAVWAYQNAPYQHLIILIGGLFMLLLLLQAGLTFTAFSERHQWVFQFASDTLLCSGLIFATGGIDSPFSILLGLLIISAGSFAWFMLPLAITILACAGYLTAVYSEMWMTREPLPDTAQALQILLQVSTLMLVGGIMAAIARRHAGLRARSARVLHQHRKLRDLHDKLMEAMCEGVIVLDDRLELSDMNSAGAALLAGRPVSVLTAIPEVYHCLHQQGRHACQCEYRHGEQVLLVAVTHLSDDADARWLLTLVDISDLRQMEWQMHQQEKMAALGQMAAILAHEVRNPVQVMLQGLEMLPGGDVKGVNVRDILHDEMLRLNRLVTTMLDYSRPLKPVPSFSYMPAVIRASLQQLDMAKQCDVDMHCTLEQLLLDGDHFRLVLDNLLANAVMNSPPGTPVGINLDADGDCWRLRVCNQGHISEQVQEKLFEPFVSGRATGIGLGLATVRQVCDVNGWSVSVRQEDGLVCFCVSALIETAADETARGLLHG